MCFPDRVSFIFCTLTETPSRPRLSCLSYYCFFPWFYELAALQIQPDTPALTIFSKRAASRMNGQGVWPGEIRWHGQLVCNNCIESWTLKVQSHLKWAMPVGAEMRYSDWPGVHGTGCWVGWSQMNKGCQHSWASPRHTCFGRVCEELPELVAWSRGFKWVGSAEQWVGVGPRRSGTPYSSAMCQCNLLYMLGQISGALKIWREEHWMPAKTSVEISNKKNSLDLWRRMSYSAVHFFICMYLASGPLSNHNLEESMF